MVQKILLGNKLKKLNKNGTYRCKHTANLFDCPATSEEWQYDDNAAQGNKHESNRQEQIAA